MHRAQSIVLSDEELVEIRASQRTFEGAYVRTALGQFSFALVVLKIFTAEFYGIGALFAVYGTGILGISLYRRYIGNRQFFSHKDVGESSHASINDGVANQTVAKKFRTSGNVVLLMSIVTVATYVALIGLTINLDVE